MAEDGYVTAVASILGYILVAICCISLLAVEIMTCTYRKKILEDQSDSSEIAAMFPESQPEAE